MITSENRVVPYASFTVDGKTLLWSDSELIQYDFPSSGYYRVWQFPFGLKAKVGTSHDNWDLLKRLIEELEASDL